MKIISEITNKEYTSVEECMKAEAEFKAAKEAAENAKASSEKKRLAGVIESCDKAVTEAYKGLKEAQDSVRKMYADARKELAELITKQNEAMKNVLQPAEQAVKDAEKAKRVAISNFNKKFGPYKKVCTGDEAIKEFEGLFSFSSLFDLLDLI